MNRLLVVSCIMIEPYDLISVPKFYFLIGSCLVGIQQAFHGFGIVELSGIFPVFINIEIKRIFIRNKTNRHIRFQFFGFDEVGQPLFVFIKKLSTEFFA